MHVVVQVLLALLAAWGLVALGWLLLGKLLTPDLGDYPVYAVVPADGDGAGLEHTVKGLLWLRGNDWTRCTIVIADGGLDPAGRAAATALMGRATGVVLCPTERLGEYLTQKG